MKWAAVLGLLWSTLLLLLLLPSGGNSKICPAVMEDIDMFLMGSQKEYVNLVASYQNKTLVKENAENLKQCVDTKLTAEEKRMVLNVLDKMENSLLC
ncbi:major allergen I polypeptide chain 1-like [Erinaceus europaeus]|uniref:Major allergen I polypeptide chain 1-like n=1 Tax=Erinaceus europaeus TaxID=9365 RepID=A0A1S3ARK8_ERIEU|nr:major allergen I polypeptide chain 1-like [Erinaceus europaeus]